MPEAKSPGFTLIELLVVLVIISITLGFALLSFGDFGAKRRLITEAEQCLTQIDLIQHQAMIESTPLAIQFNKTGWRVLRFKSPRSWEAFRPDNTLYSHDIPANITILFNEKTPNKNALVMIDPSGEMTPFRLGFGLFKKPSVVTLVGESNGNLSLEKRDEPSS